MHPLQAILDMYEFKTLLPPHCEGGVGQTDSVMALEIVTELKIATWGNII